MPSVFIYCIVLLFHSSKLSETDVGLLTVFQSLFFCFGLVFVFWVFWHKFYVLPIRSYIPQTSNTPTKGISGNNFFIYYTPDKILCCDNENAL